MNNVLLSVTGCMYVERGTMEVKQALEGMASSLMPLYERIKADRRHFIYQEEAKVIRKRNFTDWRMQNVAELELPAYVEPIRHKRLAPCWIDRRASQQPVVEGDSDYLPFDTDPRHDSIPEEIEDLFDSDPGQSSPGE